MSISNHIEFDNQNISFINFLFRHRLNRIYLYLSLTLSITIWITFKSIFKYPNLVLDSYYYIEAALSNANVNAWPIGYSKFLLFIGLFSHNAYTVTTLQYFLLNSSFLYFFFTLRYFYSFNKFLSFFLLFFFLLNPLYPFACNLILSDSSFTAFSLLWISNLLWILNRPKTLFIFVNALFLLITFTIRYTALYYPVIGILVIIISSQTLPIKIFGIALQVILILGFISFTTTEMNKVYGVKQFSPFGAWKLANNALYMYETVYEKDSGSIPLQFQSLDNTIRQFFKRPHQPADLLNSDLTSGCFYMFNVSFPASPLIQYMQQIYEPSDIPLYYKTFAPLGPLYKDYGNFLIRKHPIAFFKAVIVPNTIRYFCPHTEAYTKFTPFYMREDTLGIYAKKWFNIKSLNISHNYIDLRGEIFTFFPYLHIIIHWTSFLFTTVFLFYYGKKSFVKNNMGIIILCLLCISNFVFSIFAASSVLRHQLFIIIIEISLALYTSHKLYSYRSNNK